MKNNTKKIVLISLCTALVCIFTLVIQIPIPFGYMNFGGVLILLTAYLLPPQYAFCAGGIGSSLADLISGYAVWSIPTLIIKSLLGLVAASILHIRKPVKVISVTGLLAPFAGVLIHIAGYYLFGVILYGGFAESAVQIPGLCAEAAATYTVYLLLAFSFEKAHLPAYIHRITGVQK